MAYDDILFTDKINQSIYDFFIRTIQSILLGRNTLIYLTGCQVISSFIGMLFFLYRRSIIYIWINIFTLILAFCGLYGSITITSIFLLTHCVLTVSIGGAFFLFQVVNDFITDDSSYGDEKRTSDHVLLFIFSLPYVYDVFTGVYNYFWMKSLSEEAEEPKEQLINTDNKIEMNNYTIVKESRDELCVLCMMNKKNIAFEPCGHVACCESCAKDIFGRTKCPICRGEIKNCIKIYI